MMGTMPPVPKLCPSSGDVMVISGGMSPIRGSARTVNGSLKNHFCRLAVPNIPTVTRAVLVLTGGVLHPSATPSIDNRHRLNDQCVALGICGRSASDEQARGDEGHPQRNPIPLIPHVGSSPWAERTKPGAC